DAGITPCDDPLVDQLFTILLRVVESAISDTDRRIDRGKLWLSAGDVGRIVPRRPPEPPDRRSRPESQHSLLLQVHELFGTEPEHGDRRDAVRRRYRAAAGDFVLHLPEDRLLDRYLSWASQADRHSRLQPVRTVLSAIDCWPYCASHGSRAPVQLAE